MPAVTCRPITASTARSTTAINAVAGNPILTHSFKTLNARLHALRFRSNLVQAKWDHAVKEHREMIKALAARDGDRLRDLLVRHVRTKLRTVLETMDDPYQ